MTSLSPPPPRLPPHPQRSPCIIRSQSRLRSLSELHPVPALKPAFLPVARFITCAYLFWTLQWAERSRSLVLLLSEGNNPPRWSSAALFQIFCSPFTARKLKKNPTTTRQPNQFPATASVYARTRHPAVINACLTSKAAGEDGVKALTGRVTVICVLTFHVQSSGNRKWLQGGEKVKRPHLLFTNSSICIPFYLSWSRVTDLFFFSIFSFFDLPLLSPLSWISWKIFFLRICFFFFFLCYSAVEH